MPFKRPPDILALLARKTGVPLLETLAGVVATDSPSDAAMDLVGPIGMARRAITTGGRIAKKALPSPLLYYPRAAANRRLPTLTTASKLAEEMDLLTEGALDVRRAKQEIADAGQYWAVKEIPISRLKLDKGLDVSRAAPSKGPIITSRAGEILDGRHRALKALQEGRETIQAYVPVEPPLPRKGGR